MLVSYPVERSRSQGELEQDGMPSLSCISIRVLK